MPQIFEFWISRKWRKSTVQLENTWCCQVLRAGKQYPQVWECLVRSLQLWENGTYTGNTIIQWNEVTGEASELFKWLKILIYIEIVSTISDLWTGGCKLPRKANSFEDIVIKSIKLGQTFIVVSLVGVVRFGIAVCRLI